MGRSTMLAAAVTAALFIAPAVQAQTAGGPGRLPTGAAWGDHDLSPFYRWSQALPAEPGKVLREEDQPAQPEITAASAARRLLYTSTDARWRSGVVPVSGTLYLPKGAAPAGGWPLVAWAHGTLGVSDRCAPSWTGHKPRDAAYINRWLENGFAVVATDYQGLGGPGPHPYLNWEAEGRSVLDAARAALAARPGQIANALLVTGQSQGSGAAIGATRIAPTYAPELGLKATVATGVISRFPDAAHKVPPLSVTSPVFSMLLMLGGALPDDGPTADSLVSDKGRPVLAAGRDACSPDMAQVARRDKVDATNAFATAPDALGTRLGTVVDMPSVKIGVPILLGTGLADSLVLPRHQFGAVAALCATGSPVTWKSYEGATHNGGLHASFDDALALYRGALAGTPPASNCGSVSEPGTPGKAMAGIPYND
ncbi:MAG: lipase [Proteobacteria bacterium]|nr:lipase [Pseudomonadota bacterium]